MASKIPMDRVGEQKRNKQGELMTIVRYANCEDMTVRFEDGTERDTQYKDFTRGGVLKNKKGISNHSSTKKDRTGESYEIREGYIGTIIEYIDRKNCTVKLNDGTILKGVKYNHLKDGAVKNPNHPYVCGKGYYGQGKYKSRVDGKKTIAYTKWMSMLVRVYDEVSLKREGAYENAEVCDEWLNYQVFCEWFYENYYEIPGEKTMALDKDILHKGNKVYSPDNCCFVPQAINNLLTKSDKIRGALPIGVQSVGNKFLATISKNKKSTNLGMYNTEQEAFMAYKMAKEEWIKEVADKYKDKIPDKVYKALYNYKVEITD